MIVKIILTEKKIQVGLPRVKIVFSLFSTNSPKLKETHLVNHPTRDWSDQTNSSSTLPPVQTWDPAPPPSGRPQAPDGEGHEQGGALYIHLS